ncbi:MAG: Hint domain-containing protein, partial [Geminicoccaceae bacterium]|nr:Hint domain-containing protein [Geminicoccaceae bacterium]MDW8371907.1 Hint domain-containing protein [Geminicoccaceae bacterium]
MGVAPSLLPALKTASAETCCFRAGTRIRMADGSQRPIEALRPGDRVQGRGGRVNRVLALERTRLGRRRLWSINGSRPFVTAEHPFLAEDGWRAIDPEAGAREAPGLAIAPLRRGDRLVRLVLPPVLRVVGDEAPAFVPEPVERLETVRVLLAITGDPELPVYNLRLDGDHTYVAEGWIVHNKGGAGEEGEPGRGAGAAGGTGSEQGAAGSGAGNAGGAAEGAGGSGASGSGQAGSGSDAGTSDAGGTSGGSSGSGSSTSGAGGSSSSAGATSGGTSGSTGDTSGSSAATSGGTGTTSGSAGGGSGPSVDAPSRTESGTPSSPTSAPAAAAGRAEPAPPSAAP